MTSKTLLLGFTLLLSSCSTYKRTAIVSTVAGALIGGTGGAVFSPTKEDTAKNAFVFSALGGALGAGLAYLTKEEGKVVSLPPMIRDQHINEAKEKAMEPMYEFNGVNLTPTIELKPVGKYTLEDKDLPDNLKKHVPKRNLIEYYIPEKIINHDGKTIKIEAHKAFQVR